MGLRPLRPSCYVPRVSFEDDEQYRRDFRDLRHHAEVVIEWEPAITVPLLHAAIAAAFCSPRFLGMSPRDTIDELVKLAQKHKGA